MIKRAAAIALVSSLPFAAMAADLPTAAPVMAPPPVAATWTGFYVGGHLGWGWQNSSYTAFTPRNNYAGFSLSGMGGSALLGGMQVGYNYQFAPSFVIGVEADLSAIGLDKKSSSSSLGTVPVFTRKTSWVSTVAPRAGFVFGNALAYVKGGLALADMEVGHDQGPYQSSSSTRSGWALGAGLEYAFTRHLTGKIEYNYLGFGTHTTSFNYPGNAPFQIRDKGDMQLMKVGVNYLFN